MKTMRVTLSLFAILLLALAVMLTGCSESEEGPSVANPCVENCSHAEHVGDNDCHCHGTCDDDDCGCHGAH